MLDLMIGPFGWSDEDIIVHDASWSEVGVALIDDSIFSPDMGF